MDEQAADEAIAEISGSMVDGRTLTVNEAKPMVRTNSGGGNSHGRRAQDRY